MGWSIEPSGDNGDFAVVTDTGRPVALVFSAGASARTFNRARAFCSAEIYRWALDQIAALRPAGDIDTAKNVRPLLKHVESIAINALDAGSMARACSLFEALEPFAELAKWIAFNRPDYDNDQAEVQIEDWPYTLAVKWLRRAAELQTEKSA